MIKASGSIEEVFASTVNGMGDKIRQIEITGKASQVRSGVPDGINIYETLEYRSRVETYVQVARRLINGDSGNLLA
ncbi:hypothetical protein E2C01_076392 [Portunus trituberculatus]|uniref:Uncharacterized protein n=1 Tax=Portunus trituberculatus TaxID=210409 RepID=A0A5B7IIS2_PORTR|nr:hypothetical protein [Portunus trituberculatus]